MSLTEVVTLYESNASDIVAMLRATADEIEELEDTRAMVCIRVTDDAIIPYLWGKATTLEGIAYTRMGEISLINTALGMEDD